MMIDRLRIEHLANCPEVLPELERWFLGEWEPYYGIHGPGDAAEDLRACCGTRALPIALVGFLDGELCATAALKPESVETHKHLTPWVAAVLVEPTYRRRGIRGKLVNALEKVAAELGFEQLYYGGGVADRHLERNGWEPLERVSYLSGEGFIYRKALERGGANSVVL